MEGPLLPLNTHNVCCKVCMKTSPKKPQIKPEDEASGEGASAHGVWFNSHSRVPGAPVPLLPPHPQSLWFAQGLSPTKLSSSLGDDYSFSLPSLPRLSPSSRSPAPRTCSIICRTLRCWLFSMSSRWWIFSRSMATSFSSCADLHEAQDKGPGAVGWLPEREQHPTQLCPEQLFITQLSSTGWKCFD